jgi:hypothetical protein
VNVSENTAQLLEEVRLHSTQLEVRILRKSCPYRMAPSQVKMSENTARLLEEVRLHSTQLGVRLLHKSCPYRMVSWQTVPVTAAPWECGPRKAKVTENAARLLEEVRLHSIPLEVLVLRKSCP